jgi:beta-glucanase (GH16 family)
MLRRILILLLAAAVAVALLLPAVVQSQSFAFDDEFDGTTLDTTQWTAWNRAGDMNEQECYLASNLSVVGGFATTLTKPDAAGCAPFSPPLNYSSGGIQWASYNFLYGSIEARVKFAAFKGAHDSIWLLGANCQSDQITNSGNNCGWPQPGSDEIDIAEIMENHGYSVVNEQIHSTLGNPGCAGFPGDVTQDFHVYRLDWSASQVVWSIDGSVTCTVTQAVPQHPMFFMFNIAGDVNSGNMTGSGLPASAYLDWVHVTTAGQPTATPTSTPRSTDTPTVTPTSQPTDTPTLGPTPTPTDTVQPATATPMQMPTATPTATSSASFFVGSTSIGAAHDNSPAGEPEAFPAVAAASGTAGHIRVYIDAGNQSSKVIMGIYADGGGKPGTLLASGSVTSPTANAWNAMTIPATTITAGQTSWLAILSPVGKGTVRYRDVDGGSAPSYSPGNRTTMPTPWTTGATWPSHAISAYAYP